MTITINGAAVGRTNLSPPMTAITIIVIDGAAVVSIIAIVFTMIAIDGAAAVISIIAIMVMTITIEGAAIGWTDLAPPTTAVVDRVIVIAVIVMAAVVEVVVKAGAGWVVVAVPHP